jgi:hypothetical protein
MKSLYIQQPDAYSDKPSVYFVGPEYTPSFYPAQTPQSTLDFQAYPPLPPVSFAPLRMTSTQAAMQPATNINCMNTYVSDPPLHADVIVGPEWILLGSS